VYSELKMGNNVPKCNCNIFEGDEKEMVMVQYKRSDAPIDRASGQAKAAGSGVSSQAGEDDGAFAG
jgi:hypothetical protein